MSLIGHIERNLGTIIGSWKLPEEDGLQVLKFQHRPFEGVDTYCSLGMSNNVLTLNNGRDIRQEFIFSVDSKKYKEEEVASFLLTCCQGIKRSGVGVLRGELIGPGESVIPDVKSNSLYCSIPVFFQDSFNVYHSDSDSVVFVWLLPLTNSDFNYVNNSGWNDFEDKLEEVDLDMFWDLDENLVS